MVFLIIQNMGIISYDLTDKSLWSIAIPFKLKNLAILKLTEYFYDMKLNKKESMLITTT
jgi:hypothetical protein